MHRLFPSAVPLLGKKPNQVVVEPLPLGRSAQRCSMLGVQALPSVFCYDHVLTLLKHITSSLLFQKEQEVLVTNTWPNVAVWMQELLFLWEVCIHTLVWMQAAIGAKVSGSSSHWAAARRTPVPAALELAAILRSGAHCFSRMQSQPEWSSSSCIL